MIFSASRMDKLRGSMPHSGRVLPMVGMIDMSLISDISMRRYSLSRHIAKHPCCAFVSNYGTYFAGLTRVC